MTHNVPNDKRNSPDMLAPHSERLWILGGVWLAIASLGFMGSSALINPEMRLPVIDPLLEMLAQGEDQADTMLTMEEQVELMSQLSPVVPVVPAVKQLLPEPLVMPEIQVVESPAVTPAPAPIAEQSSKNVPFWVYVIIIASCATGSSLITYSLYRLNRLSSAHRQGKPQRRVAPRQTKRPVQLASPVENLVEAIAPLHIKTPTNVKPLQVQLEAVVDPQPVRKKISRAEQLAHLAQQAQQQQPKSLVERMDIRRRNGLAPFS